MMAAVSANKAVKEAEGESGEQPCAVREHVCKGVEGAGIQWL